MIIIAHRGYSAKYPENTISSFQAAMDASADMIEFDVLLSQDNVPVIIHDNTLDRTTNGIGKVSAMKLNDLQKLNAGNGEKIPTLEEVLQLAKGKLPIHIEIKSEAVAEKNSSVEEQVVALVDKYQFSTSCIISSFALKPLQRIKQINPHLEIAMTFDHALNDSDKSTIEKLQPVGIHLPIHKITTEDMDFASTHHLEVCVFTVNNPAHMKQAQDLCVEGIFTNEVENAIRYFTKRK